MFDARQHALPVAWVITRSFMKHEVSKWLKALYDRILAADPTWKVNGFIIDDAVLETDPIRWSMFSSVSVSFFPECLIST